MATSVEPTASTAATVPSTQTTPISTTTTTTLPAGATVPVTTTFTSSSQQCVATLEAQVLTNGLTGLVMAGEDFVTLDHTCSSMTTTPASRYYNSSSSYFEISSSSSYYIPSASASDIPIVDNNNSGTSPGMIAGLVLGVVAILSCLGAAGFWFWLRRRRNSTTIFTAKAKMLEEDRSDEIRIRWEKDSAEIKESDAAEVKEMSAPVPVEMGDGRSIVETDATPLSPISIDTSDGRDTLCGDDIDDIVSPLSPYR